MNSFVPVSGFSQTFTKVPQTCYPQAKCQVPQAPCFKLAKPKCSPCDTSKPLWILGAIVLAGLLIWLITWAISSTCKSNAGHQPPAPAPTPPVNPVPATGTLPAAAAGAIAGAAASAAVGAVQNPTPVASGATMVPQNAQPIDKPAFDSLKANNQAFVVMFYSDQCGYCRSAFPHYDAAAQKCALPMFLLHQRNFSAQDNIRGVPVIRAYHSNGSTEDMMGSRDTANIQKFVNTAAQRNPAQAAQFQAQKNAASAHAGHKGKGALASAYANNSKNNSINWRSAKKSHRHSH